MRVEENCASKGDGQGKHFTEKTKRNDISDFDFSFTRKLDSGEILSA